MQALQIKDRKWEDAEFFSAWCRSIPEWSMQQIILQRPHAFLWLPVALACGIGLYFCLPFDIPLGAGLVLWLFTVCLYGLTRKTALFLPVMLIVSGFALAQARTAFVHTPILEKKLGPVEIMGTIMQVEDQEGYQGKRLLLKDLEIEDLPPEETPRLIRLTLRDSNSVQTGQRIKGLASLNPPSGPVLPGGFDFRRYMYFQSIGAVGFMFRAPEVLSEPVSLFDFEDIRQRIADKIRAALDNERQAAFITALTVGKRQAVTEEDELAWRDSGLAHLLSISGLHITLMAGAIFFAVRLLMACFPSFALRYPIKKIAAVFGIAGALCYMVLSGASIPTQRSVFMCGIVFFAIMIDRSPLSMRLITFAALVVLAITPESLISVSFQMSFAAVAALIAFYDATRAFWIGLSRDRGIPGQIGLYFMGVSVTSVIASIATAPFSLYHFQQFAILGILANLVAIPLTAIIIMPFSLVAFLLMPLGLGLEYYPLLVIGWSIEIITETAYWVASLPAAVILVPAWPFHAFLLIVCGGVFGLLWQGWGRLLAVPLIAAGIIMAHGGQRPDILISESYKLFAFRQGETYYLNSRRGDKFAQENWARYLGFLPEDFGLIEKAPEFSSCDEEGCRMNIEGRNISFVKDPYATRQECAWADLVIGHEPVSSNLCPDTVLVIDRFDAWRDGALAVYLDDPGIRIDRTVFYVGDRPWAAR